MIITAKSNISAIRAKLQYVLDNLDPVIQQGFMDGGALMTTALGQAAPKGKSEDPTTIPGDAPGPLSQSFQAIPLAPLGVSIITTQPTKLKFVKEGTGLEGPLHHLILPTVKKALYWKGAYYPVRSTKGMKPNDFVTPTVDATREPLKQAVRRAVVELVATLGV
jgi:hypothetical protein